MTGNFLTYVKTSQFPKKFSNQERWLKFKDGNVNRKSDLYGILDQRISKGTFDCYRC